MDKLRYEKYYKFRSQIYPKLTLVAYTIFPLTIIIIGNALIVRTVRQASKRSRSTTQKKRSVTRMLYAVSILYTVLTTPASIFLAVAPTSYQLAPAFRLQWTLLRLLFYLCHSVNFILFCASGTFFRQELIAFLNSIFCYELKCVNRIVNDDDGTLNNSTRFRKNSSKSSTKQYRKNKEKQQTDNTDNSL